MSLLFDPVAPPSAELMDRISKAAGTSTAMANTVIGNLVYEGMIERLGRGVKGEPYRYFRSFNREGVNVERK
jgi:predicted transcriptional regulator